MIGKWAIRVNPILAYDAGSISFHQDSRLKIAGAIGGWPIDLSYRKRIEATSMEGDLHNVMTTMLEVTAG